jgi:hypothetical protein
MPEIKLMKNFDIYKREIEELTMTINELDNEVNTHVYQLYGLSENEIALIESSL